jgi:hypothetical protein
MDELLQRIAFGQPIPSSTNVTDVNEELDLYNIKLVILNHDWDYEKELKYFDKKLKSWTSWIWQNESKCFIYYYYNTGDSFWFVTSTVFKI